MRNPLQEQLLKAGLVKKSKVAEVAREHAKARHGKKPVAPTESQREADRARQEKAERDRVLEQSRNADARAREMRVQARQLIADGRVPATGERAYRFDVDGGIRSLLVDDTQARQLADGSLVIARLDDGFAAIPRGVATRVYERDAAAVVLDHGSATPSETADAGYEDPRYAVPDDLIW